MPNFSLIILIGELFLDSLFKIDSAIRTVEGNVFLFNEKQKQTKKKQKNQFLTSENKKYINSGISRTRRLKFG